MYIGTVVAKMAPSMSRLYRRPEKHVVNQLHGRTATLPEIRLTLVKPSFSIHGITAKLTPNANVFLKAVKLVIDSPATGR